MTTEVYTPQKTYISMKNKFLITALLTVMFSSCVAVKEYDKVNINDADMSLNDRKETKFSTTFQVYREGASGANGGKSGGGCGCN